MSTAEESAAAWVVPKIWRFIKRVVGHTPQAAPHSAR